MSGQSDEGVDMRESRVYQTSSSKCVHYNDCTCIDGYNDEGAHSNHDSLNSGSEFEEFTPVKGNFFPALRNTHDCSLIGCKADENDQAWTEEWEDFSSCQDLLTVLRQQKQE